jgi:RNA polymerase sigma factor (sigma-70 family)
MKLSERDETILRNLGLAKSEAHKFSLKCPEPFDDLCQVGYLGLIKAVERFDPSRGFAFSSYAVPLIQGEIRHYLRDKSSVVRIPKGHHSNTEAALSFDAEDGLSNALVADDISPEPYDDLTFEALRVVDKLKPRLRDTLNALYFDGMSMQEYADSQGVCWMTVSRDKRAALKWVKERVS